MGHHIETVSARAKLTPRREPYWQRVKRGVYVGYRKMVRDGHGTWIARVRGPDGKQTFRPLGPFDDVPGNERFDRAVDATNAWLAEAPSTSRSSDVKTVGDACEAYVRHLIETKGPAVAQEVESRFRRWVKPNRIWSLTLAALTREDCRDFKRSLTAAPIKRGDGQAARSRSSVNRDLTPVRAALNLAFADGRVNSDQAWREMLKPYKNADRPRSLYLDLQQREALIGKAPPDLALFLRGLSALPLRPGALASLQVGFFEPRLGSLRIGKDKHGQDRKLTLGPQLAQLLSEACQGKEETQPIFARADGRAWNKDAWKDPVKSAAASAGLPSDTTAYTLRHSVITDLVHGGLDLLTVGQISGTSVAMIERHYGHLRSEVAAAALERLFAARGSRSVADPIQRATGVNTGALTAT